MNKIFNFDEDSINAKLTKQDSKKRVQFDEEENKTLIYNNRNISPRNIFNQKDINNHPTKQSDQNYVPNKKSKLN